MRRSARMLFFRRHSINLERDTEKISMAPAQGWHAQIEKWFIFFFRFTFSLFLIWFPILPLLIWFLFLLLPFADFWVRFALDHSTILYSHNEQRYQLRRRLNCFLCYRRILYSSSWLVRLLHSHEYLLLVEDGVMCWWYSDLWLTL